MILFSKLKNICEGKILLLCEDVEVKSLLIDSRKMGLSLGAVFFAIDGERNDGHNYIEKLYVAGVKNFIVEKIIETKMFPLANILLVKSSVDALQKVASYNRSLFHFPVIGITGSNGKTIIKEWLSNLLAPDFSIVKNPGSYNSQVGVPLSIWQLAQHHELGIFEAGISKVGEMQLLEKVMQPTIGIISNIGSAHDEGFENQGQKIAEKLMLFRNSNYLIYCKDHYALALAVEKAFGDEKLISWGKINGSKILWLQNSETEIQITWQDLVFTIQFPFSDKASQENAGHCIAAMLLMKCDPATIQKRISQIKSVPMRLELKQAINNCQLIDDSYNNDLGGLQIGLNFLSGFHNKKKIIVLSDILQSGLDEEALVDTISSLIVSTEVDSFIGIGNVLKKYSQKIKARIPQAEFYLTTHNYLESKSWNNFRDAIIFLKGARNFQFEKIAHQLQRKIHGTVLEIDLSAMVHNLNFFKAKLKPSVKLMVMVKAFAYGSGSEQVASLLQYHKIDYLGVAYADEGVELRKSGIQLPIMVMNPSNESFDTLLHNKLEPEMYSFKILTSLINFLNGRECKIHLKIDTGMHRLGFIEQEIDELISQLSSNKNLQIASVFTHFASADEKMHDEFTTHQAESFKKITKQLKQELAIDPILHILNSSGILRFKDYQLDMVRLGIGLYGINPTQDKVDQLIPVTTLKTIISQIKRVSAGETIGYGRWGKPEKEMTIATIAIGYADGFSRAFSKGVGSVLINGCLAPVVGNVCMDMTMVDISNIKAKEGDEVIVFGKEYPIHFLSKAINTIPYEILTSTSERVKRLFYTESI